MLYPPVDTNLARLLNVFRKPTPGVFIPDLRRRAAPLPASRQNTFKVPPQFEIDPPTLDLRPLCFAMGVNLSYRGGGTNGLTIVTAGSWRLNHSGGRGGSLGRHPPSPD